MNIKTNLLEDYFDFVDSTTQNFFEKIIVLLAIIVSLFL